MLNANLVKQLITFKKPKIAEIECTFFENCDVNCAFCGHDKQSTVGLSQKEMLSKLKPIEEFLDNIDDDIHTVNLHMVGGELLQDRLIGDDGGILYDYDEFIERYDELCQKRGLETNIYLVTNMLTTKYEMVDQWLTDWQERVNIKIIASYDLAGRPLGKQYKSNMKFLKSHISNVNVVCTKQALKKLAKGDKYFDYLYNNFEIFMDDFLPDKWTEYMIPSDEDYLAYLKLLAKQYPNVMPWGEAVQKMKDQRENELQFTTFNKINILPDNTVTNYLFDKRHRAEYFIGEVNYKDNANMLYNFIESNECMSCEHYRHCPLRCPVSWSWKNRERSKGCVNKRFFDWVSNDEV